MDVRELLAVSCMVGVSAAGAVYQSVNAESETAGVLNNSGASSTGEAPTGEQSPDDTPEPEPVAEGVYLPPSWTSQVAALVTNSPVENDCLSRVAELEAEAEALQGSKSYLACTRPLPIVTTETRTFPVPESGKPTDLEPDQVWLEVRRAVNPRLTRVGIAAYSYDGRIYVTLVGAL